MLRVFALILAVVLAGPAWSEPLAARNDPLAESFVMAQRAYVSSAGNALRQIALQAAGKQAGLAPILRLRQDAIEALSRAEAALSDAMTDDRIAVPALSAAVADQRGVIARLEADVERRFAGFAALARPAPLSLTETKALLAPDEALLFTFVAQDTTFVWFIRKDVTVWFKPPLGRADLGQVVQEIRAGLGVTTTPTRAAAPLDASAGQNLPEFRLDLTQALYRLLVQPAGDALIGVAHLMIVADGPLAALPFHLLTSGDEDASPSSDPAILRAAPWLIRDMAVTTLPSVEALAALRQGDAQKGEETAATPKEQRLFAMGNPVLGRAISAQTALTRGGLGDVTALAALAPLPATARELRSIAAQFAPGHADVLLAGDATETALRAAAASGELGAADVIVFATHGLLSGELGLAEPALVLTPPDTATASDDGLLTASEISALTLSASWVVLSACNTAASDGRADADGLSGLTRSFLLAGARGMLVSHWPVRDDAAARLTTTAFAEMAAAPPGHPLRRAEALRRAMLAVMADPSDDSLAHPFAWAPFTMVGEGGF